ncbi:nuclear transport factor 2 family protein [Nonomuraea polychroma]|uniref:nuclear transport factor 2 family protein n=1 Tax=Nonomuraea polychroma TaxID=46176 RepID=UPI003D8FC112
MHADALSRLRDQAEIIELISRYFFSLDSQAFDDAWANSLFTQEAVLTFPVGSHQGLAGLADFTVGFMSNWARTQHHATNHLITFDGDRANVTWNVLATHVHPAAEDAPPAAEHFHLGGRFDGEAVRTSVGWRFGRLALKVIWMTGRAAARVPRTI